tara:strand:+ start:326 stop:586 length:261 start_codon:yes stop_codon:yes gene_type:complete
LVVAEQERNKMLQEVHHLVHILQEQMVLILLLASYPHVMAVVAVVVTNLIHLVIMVDLVVVDQMVVQAVVLYSQVHLLLMHLGRVM